ncbi:MAG TPA: HAD family phosphatase [Candidatus Saccharimonadales bacterium]|nr:HAD family phosphatase [Candidatus Saccharimonadales bacterium]
MIRAVVFDCFGVLASDGWLPYKARHFGDDPERMEQATELNRQVDAGIISFNDFMRSIADMAGLSEAEARQQIENNIPDEDVFAIIARLKPRYKIGLLSNAGDNWLNDIFTPEQVAQFDAVALSYDMGHSKPEFVAYQTIARRLDVVPEECIFIDDQPRYVAGAEAAGMHGILYTDAEHLQTELTRLMQLS